MSAPKLVSVEDYLVAQGPAKGETLRSIIDFILARFPELEAKLSWNVPQIHRGKDYVFGFSAAKGHLTLAPWSPRIIENFQPQLEGYVVLKNCFHVPVDWKLDEKLIEDLVRARLAELD